MHGGFGLSGHQGHDAAPETGARQTRAGGPGLIDMTRLALSSYDMWRDILETNAGHVDAALAAVIERLESMRSRLREESLSADFADGAELRRKLVSPVRLK